jgi:hypothetical protein
MYWRYFDIYFKAFVYIPILNYLNEKKRDSDLRDLHSIESFQDLWLKEVISLKEMELVENQSMVKNSL